MAILTELVAKILGITEAILDNFVSLGTPVANPLLNNCYGPISQIPVTLLPCGNVLADQIANLAVLGLNILGVILPGLLATNAGI